MDKSTSAIKSTHSQRKIIAPEKKPLAQVGGLGCRVIYQNKAKKKSGFLGAARAIFAKNSVSKQSARASVAAIDPGPPAPKYVPAPPPHDAAAAGKSAHAGTAYDEGTAFTFLFEDAANKAQLGTGSAAGNSANLSVVEEGPPPPNYIPKRPDETMRIATFDELDELGAQAHTQFLLKEEAERKRQPPAGEVHTPMPTPSAGNEPDEPGSTGTSITGTSVAHSGRGSGRPDFMKNEPMQGDGVVILLSHVRIGVNGKEVKFEERDPSEYNPLSMDIAGGPEFFEHAAKQAGLDSDAS